MSLIASLRTVVAHRPPLVAVPPPSADQTTTAAVTGAVDPTAARVPASQVPSIQGVRISPHGADAALINISPRGLLAECGIALRPGTKVTITFSGGFTPAAVPGRVARCAVARMAPGGIRYEIGVAFDELLPLPETQPEPTAGVNLPAPILAVPILEPRPGESCAVRNRW